MMKRIAIFAVAAMMAAQLTGCAGLDRGREDALNWAAGVDLAQSPDGVTLRLPETVLFDFSRSDLRPDAGAAIDRSVAVLSRSEKPVVVEGHTDNAGSREVNQALSQARANAVAMALEKKGIAASRIGVKGFAYDRPIADNRTDDGRAQNRRAEIKIVDETVDRVLGKGDSTASDEMQSLATPERTVEASSESSTASVSAITSQPAPTMTGNARPAILPPATTTVDQAGEHATPQPASVANNTAVNQEIEKPAAIQNTTRTGFVWPVQGRVSSPFLEGKTHGMLVAGEAGEPIKAIAAGRVVYAGSAIEAYGLLVIIKHADGFVTGYGHNGRLLVKDNEAVRKGQTIAEMGKDNDGRGVLQLEIRRNGRQLDPLKYLPAQKN